MTGPLIMSLLIAVAKYSNDAAQTRSNRKHTNDGITPNYFTLERGVRQGDSLSWPYVYVVAVEVLAIAIQQNI